MLVTCHSYSYIGLLQVNLAGELFANLIQRTGRPITKPVENTSTDTPENVRTDAEIDTFRHFPRPKSTC